MLLNSIMTISWGQWYNGFSVENIDQATYNVIKIKDKILELNKKFVLMSNAPRPTQDVEKFLLKLKMNKIFTQKIFTSGEAALNYLKKNLSNLAEFLNKDTVIPVFTR